jgi:uncharacterized protein GlcG (DUF336 family)
MTKPMTRIHNAETNEIIDSEMTAVEFAQYKADRAASLERQTAEQEKATAKAALLDRLGITEEEAKLLLA